MHSPNSPNRSRLALMIAPLVLAACSTDAGPPEPEYRMTIDELLLQDARRCDSGFEYPSSLVDGIGVQLVQELQCMDEDWLEFYTPCRESGCIWPDGPQPHALRPEVVEALQIAAASIDDFISISAGYRDVAMQYYSRWYKENCNSSFDAAIPGESNHQGGRAIDVRYPDFWWDTLLENGFEHPIPTDGPHFELIGTAAFRAESAELQQLSIEAFQRLWNRNNPGDRIPEDGVYGAVTKDRLGRTPVEGFTIGACPPGSGGDPDPDAGTDAGIDAGIDIADATPDTSSDAAHEAGSDATAADTDDAGGPDATPADIAFDTSADGSDAGTDPSNDDPAPNPTDTSGLDATADALENGGGTASTNPLPMFSRMGATPPDTRGCSTARRSPGPPALLLVMVASLFGQRRRPLRAAR